MNSEPDPRQWIGRRETAEDTVAAAAVGGMSATMDRDDPPPEPGTPLPALWHWMLFAPRVRASGLGADGHPARGGFMPPVDLPRRMFAGARLRFHAPLRVGDAVRREAEITDVTAKSGRSGSLLFVTVDYRYLGPRGLALEEVQDIVYRDHPSPGAPSGAAGRPEGAFAWRRTVTPDPILLFRYSALTFNAHRIHYDRAYAIDVEGYPGLVVHGPLIACHLAELAQVGGRSLATFRFKARQPIFDTAPFEIAGNPTPDGTGCRLVALSPEGTIAMEAEATYGPEEGATKSG